MESPAKTGHSPSGYDSGNKYRQLIETEEFKELIQKKKAFIVPVTLFFLAFYFVLPILAAYTEVLKGEAFFHIPWAWIYALLQFAVVWIGGIVYIKKSAKYDKLAKNILKKYEKELGE
ncbi:MULTISPECIES: DUF485 domain-containing protein [unclassified Bacillus (in: firmicutes)]|uniref:DUF485 domain-containing protein n=1 Tax=unclassified Bacillus (in: firmicutes) TaxID=185979 RepID=UPI001BE54AF9|nr:MULTISPECIES: DUF485 domain-containing protein [unclassified Bacillus (in: firmicutes)]MBT2614741.1 DUF485 domain-containing protein [Bacillus sp. ISL-78]MBT2631961.1 DUF485 domain-containing protein [Bacillus sp. ISL-101]MBT2715721.1 DUF485 domain-containing protein [Bacillus sp. ISL-57]